MLKGRTKIELTDVHTGEKQVIEKHNMITGALDEIYQPVLGHMTQENVLRPYTPAHTSVLGGIYLFDQTLTESRNTHFAPAGVTLTGCARYNYVNSGSSTVLGSYNVNESRFDETNRQMKFVYDFNTSQGNGTIASVCLTHLDGGYGTYGANVSYSAALGKSCYTQPKQLLVGGKDMQSGVSIGNYSHLFLLDVDNDVGYYFTATDAKHITITKRQLGLKNFSLFTQALTILETNELPELNTGLSGYITYNFDLDDNALYISASSAGSINVNASFTVTKISFGTWQIQQYTVTNTGDQTLYGNGRYSFVHQGYVYLRSNNSPYSVYAVQLTNSANITKLSGTMEYACDPVYATAGRVYYQYIATSSSISGRMYLTDRLLGKLKYSGNMYINCMYYSSYYRNCSFMPIKNHPMLTYMTYGSSGSSYSFYYLANYLATINNLTEAVVKTADKTMKITYIIEEVEE